MLGRNDGGVQLVTDGRTDDDDRTCHRNDGRGRLDCGGASERALKPTPAGGDPEGAEQAAPRRELLPGRLEPRPVRVEVGRDLVEARAVPVAEYEGAVGGKPVCAELQARAAELVGGTQQPVELVVRQPAVGGLVPRAVERRRDRPLREAAGAEARVAVRRAPSGLALRTAPRLPRGRPSGPGSSSAPFGEA